MTATPQRPGLTNWLLIITLGIIWGSAFMSVRLTLEGFTPWQTAAGRTILGALLLTAIGTSLGQGPHKLGSKRGMAIAVIIGIGAVALPFALLSWGQQHVPSAFAGVAMGAVPLLVLPLVWLFSPEEGIGPRRIIGMLLGFAGILTITGPGALSATNDLTLWGRLACIGAALCYACGSVLTRRAPAMPPLAFASVTLIAAALTLTPIALLRDGLPAAWPRTPTLALLYAAALPTALAAVIRVRVITTAGSLFMSNTSYMVPVWSVIFGIALMDEILPDTLYVGLALILAGIAISQSRARAAHSSGKNNPGGA